MVMQTGKTERQGGDFTFRPGKAAHTWYICSPAAVVVAVADEEVKAYL